MVLELRGPHLLGRRVQLDAVLDVHRADERPLARGQQLAEVERLGRLHEGQLEGVGLVKQADLVVVDPDQDGLTDLVGEVSPV